ncbi:Uncharacterized protein OBRU01_10898 [Operophtera brumata]|uniref:Uncharacterized protein n=1 Tax=Operophtera brumata TaxID=104452 RepID=A0A0L7L8F9_OPEBR|nr:Uncharacterized protein OBRU01_10898 [Operophtera brumata]
MRRWRDSDPGALRLYLCVTLRSAGGGTAPLRLAHSPLRRSLALFNDNNRSVPVVITQMKHEGRWLVTVSEDPCPQLVVHNNTKTALSVAQPAHQGDEPSTSKVMSITSESAYSVKQLLDTTSECLNSLKNLGLPTSTWDAILIYMTVTKLDGESHKMWEQHLSLDNDNMPSLEALFQFLESRFRSMEMIEYNSKPYKPKTFHAAVAAPERNTSSSDRKTNKPINRICMHSCIGDTNSLKHGAIENEVFPTERKLTKEEQQCEDIYKHIVTRTETGLPFKENISTPVELVGKPKEMAISRYKTTQLERRYQSNTCVSILVVCGLHERVELPLKS